ncbi:MAG: beta-methylgalactoside transporter [Lachnospiraceae bacterium]|jgi:methyl-galactoside transport system permease protein|nr:beta-methylgalactoside transporter [Lachnospiraceae bacterium]
MNKKSGKDIKNFLQNNSIIILLVILVIVVAVLKDNFFGKSNITNTASNVAVRMFIALGVSGCLITKGTDLSAGRLVGLSACLSGILLQTTDAASKFYPNLGDMNIFLVLLIVIAITAVFGLINGLVIAILKVPPFIATLGMQQLVYGICLIYTKATPLGGFREDYTNIAKGKILAGWLPYLVIIALIVGFLMWFLYNKTRHGKYMYAIGGNEVAAEVSGVNVTKTKILIYVLAAILYACAGFLLAAKTGGATVNAGQGYELEAIAACTIGGVSTNGGIGRISGIFVGVLVFELLKVCLQFLGVPSDYTYVVQGLVIIVAVALDIRKYLSKK